MDICGNNWLSICKTKTKVNLTPLYIYLYANVCICVSTCTHSSRQTTDINLCTQIINLLEENVKKKPLLWLSGGKDSPNTESSNHKRKMSTIWKLLIKTHFLVKQTGNWKTHLPDLEWTKNLYSRCMRNSHELVIQRSVRQYLKGWSGVSHKILMEADKGVRGHLVIAQREMLVETMVRRCNLSTSKNNGDVKSQRCQHWEWDGATRVFLYYTGV